MQNDFAPSGVTVDSKSKARNFYKGMNSLDLMTYAHFLHDILMALSRLSLQLQDPTCMLGDVKDSMSAKIEILERYKTK